MATAILVLKIIALVVGILTPLLHPKVRVAVSKTFK